MAKQSDIIVTDYKDAIFVSVKYEQYEIVDTGEGAYIRGHGAKKEDKLKVYDKTALVSLLNLCEDLEALIAKKEWSTCGNAGEKMSLMRISLGEAGAERANLILHDGQCRARVIKWCNQYGLPLDEESPGTGSSLERFIFSLLYLSTKFHELQEGYRSDRAFKYVMSGRLIYDIDIIEGVPKMSVVFKSIVELAQLQLGLSLINGTGEDTVIQCKCCGRWFVGNSKRRYCGDPCTKQNAYKKRQSDQKKADRKRDGLLTFTVKRGG